MAELAPAGAGRIFISYRREETAYPAGWLRDRLTEEFGEGQVFKDVNSIELGEDFVDKITGAVGSCDVLLALIGRQWATITDDEGRRRLDDSDDFVRLEIEAALERDVLVIPILVEGAAMPEPEDVPPSVAKLTRRHALELSPSRFESDVQRLLRVLDRTIPRARPAPTGPSPDPAPSSSEVAPAEARRPVGTWLPNGKLIGVGVAGALLLLLVIVAVLNGSEDEGSSSDSSSSVIFQDDFSTDAAGWQATGLGTASLENGVYRLSAEPTAEGGSLAAAPRKAANVYPSAPPNVSIEVHALRVSSTGAGAGIALLCRVNGTEAYQFTMWNRHVSIAKLTVQAPYFVELTSDGLTVDPNGPTIMRADCTNRDDRQYLAFSLNGNEVSAVEDTDHPLTAGSIGVAAVVGPGDNTITAHLDELTVIDLG